MEKLRALLKKNQKKLMNMQNVVGVGLGYKEKAGAQTRSPNLGVVVLVKEKKPEHQLSTQHIVPKDLEGIETDVIEVGHIRLLARTGEGIPAQPGVSIGHYKITAGTFGAVVKDRKTGERLILSNNHVLANGSNGKDGRAQIGDPILLPGPHDGGVVDRDVIAKLYKFQPVTKVYTQSACEKAGAAEFWVNALFKLVAPNYTFKVLRQSSGGNVIDAALAKPIDPDRLNPEIMDLGEVKGLAEVEVGMPVVKSGRTTGITNGVVKAVNASVQVDMGDGEEAVFDDQIIASSMSQGGDSGALVLNNRNQAVGLLFAGSDKVTIFNPIRTVMEVLDITF